MHKYNKYLHKNIGGTYIISDVNCYDRNTCKRWYGPLQLRTAFDLRGKLQRAEFYEITGQEILAHRENKTNVFRSIIINIDKVVHVFEYERVIKCDSYGCVILYVSSDMEYIICKYATKQGNIDRDIDILRTLKETSFDDNLYVYSVSVISDKIPLGNMIVSEYMDGNLVNLLEKYVLAQQNYISIILALCNIIRDLENINLHFTDMKMENILYKCEKNGTVRLVIADFGGIASIYDPGITTYPSILEELSCSNRPFIRQTKQCIYGVVSIPSITDSLWSLGATILALFGLDKFLLHSSVKKYIEDLPKSKDYANEWQQYEQTIRTSIQSFIAQMRAIDNSGTKINEIVWSELEALLLFLLQKPSQEKNLANFRLLYNKINKLTDNIPDQEQSDTHSLNVSNEIIQHEQEQYNSPIRRENTGQDISPIRQIDTDMVVS